MLNQLLLIGAGLLAIFGSIIGAMKFGESRGKDKERLAQAQENIKNEKIRDDINTTVRNTPTDKLHDGFYRD